MYGRTALYDADKDGNSIVAGQGELVTVADVKWPTLTTVFCLHMT
jgi:hypothetical protein